MLAGIVTQICPTLCDPMDCSPPGSSVRGISQARILGWVAMPSSRGSSQPRDPTSWQADSLLSDPPGNPKNTGVSSPSLLEGIFLIQELNWGLLHCRQILCQLSYQGNWVFWVSLGLSGSPRWLHFLREGTKAESGHMCESLISFLTAEFLSWLRSIPPSSEEDIPSSACSGGLGFPRRLLAARDL